MEFSAVRIFEVKFEKCNWDSSSKMIIVVLMMMKHNDLTVMVFNRGVAGTRNPRTRPENVVTRPDPSKDFDLG